MLKKIQKTIIEEKRFCDICGKEIGAQACFPTKVRFHGMEYRPQGLQLPMNIRFEFAADSKDTVLRDICFNCFNEALNGFLCNFLKPKEKTNGKWFK